jgi:type II restriction enzyme
MRLVRVTITDGKVIQLKPGKQSRLVKAIIEELVPHYAKGSSILYVGEADEKWKFFDQEALRAIGMEEIIHGNMPDVVLYQPVKNWLFLVEAAINHGPIDVRRHGELSNLFNCCTARLLYVSAFSTQSELSPYVADISWETEVWFADEPAHLIYFNGGRSFGPYD